MTTRRAAAYVRVSSEEQTEGWSLEGQEQQIREYAERNGYEIVQVYHDETSGSREQRPGLERMLMDAHAGLFSAIIVMHTSRLFRNLALARRYKDLLRNKLDIEVLFVQQPAIDPADPMAFVMETMNELFDEYYLHQLRFWTTLGKQTRARRGLWNGTLPFGYVTGEDGVPIPHPENAAGLRLAFEAYSTGRYSDRQIADLLNREGYRTTGRRESRRFTKDTVNRLLRNVFYLGFVKYRDELYPGLHPPLISQELFERCQEVRATRRRHARAMGQTKQVYVLAGIARCHVCGLTLRCWRSKAGEKWRYYRHTASERGFDCTVPDGAIRAMGLEQQWSEIVSAIRLPADWRERIEALAGNAGEREAILREREEVQEKLRRLKQLYRDMLVDDAEYRTAREQLQARMTALVLPGSPHLLEAGEYLENLGMLWSAATLAERRDISRVMLEAVYVDIAAVRIVSIRPKPVFRVLLTGICENIGTEVL